ncbi:MAG: MFS transporter [Candidatus Fraserbacteria bacterium RBG_16_55_9]|uniref:MFS transporter n=1 Tax=Fraserbacteria sp. (strain RBG_16_55_9) TaxID=1817864 RepID=A0A1F5V2W6_FRAXR|nr:MAG: MFS transporter [Candidatus Fraserbacteria bacterium RBG_16_55_9]
MAGRESEGNQATPAKLVSLGLRANWQQFTLLVVINAFVGAMVGLERTVVPLIAEAEFGLASKSAVLSFLISFGLVKALANLFAGRFSDHWGRKRILIVGWLVGLPVPLMLIFAPSWLWIVFANVLLGINQGLCWSTTVIMKIDLVGPKQRGLAMGLNEFAGYVSVSLAALASGYLAAVYGLRPVPFYPGLAFALMGFLLSLFFVDETRPHARHEARTLHPSSQEISFAQILLLTSWKDRALFSASQAGMVNNLNDGMVWGLLPLFLTNAGLPLEQVGLITAAYPGTWGLTQLATGVLSDRWGRKWMIASGMGVQAIGIWLFVISHGFWPWLGGAVLLGLGTALVYPTLLAAISDVAHPDWRASAVGVYRLWRDGGYAVGALTAGLLADAFSLNIAIAAIGGLTLLSGVIVSGVMYETLPSRRNV